MAFGFDMGKLQQIQDEAQAKSDAFQLSLLEVLERIATALEKQTEEI